MNKAKIHYISGGQRSGKSEYAEKTALSLTETPTYLATSKVWDEEYNKRINTHKGRRESGWITIEEEVLLSQIENNTDVILVDCITLWLTNIYDQHEYNAEESFEFAIKEWNKLCAKDITLIVVSNEIGMGVVPMEKSTRAFVDMHGKMNQYIAKQAEKATLVVSGLPLTLK